jgi:hypothetical protein
MSDARPASIPSAESLPLAVDHDKIVCPVCGEEGVREKCKIICRSDKCHARVIYNCSEF